MSIDSFKLIVAVFALIGFALMPILTFLLLFTSVGKAYFRWSRNQPATGCLQFTVRQLILGMTLIAIFLATLVKVVPDVTVWMIIGGWISFSMPMTVLMVLLRIGIEIWSERKYVVQQRLAAEANTERIQEPKVQPEERLSAEDTLSLRHHRRGWRYVVLRKIVLGNDWFGRL